MPDLPAIALTVYALGVVIGLLRIDARWPARLALAFLWPLGPLAFVVVIAILLLALPIAFPVVGSIVLATIVIALILIAR